VAGGPQVCLGHRPLLGGLAHLNQALLALLLQALHTLLQPHHLSISSLHEEAEDEQAAEEAEAEEEEGEEEEGGEDEEKGGEGEEEEEGEEEGEEDYKKQRDRESAAAAVLIGLP